MPVFSALRQLLQLEPDAIAVDTAHGHSKGVLQAVALLRRKFPAIPILAGNVVTRDAVRDLVGQVLRL